MSNLWRTQRIRFPEYKSDGMGRDYYIKFDNGGYWADQFHISKKPDYERCRYSNYHTLFHAAAPYKYMADGHGRENYILFSDGLRRDPKSLLSFKLEDFLRNGKSINGAPLGGATQRRRYMSQSEKRYNNQLQGLEKKLIKRLYTEPMKEIMEKKRKQKEEDDYFDSKAAALGIEKEDNKIENNTLPSLEKHQTGKSVEIRKKMKINIPKEENFENEMDMLMRQSGEIQHYELEHGRRRMLTLDGYKTTTDNFASINKRKKIFGNRRYKGNLEDYEIGNNGKIKTTVTECDLTGENIFKKKTHPKRKLIVSELDLQNPKIIKNSFSQKNDLTSKRMIKDMH